MSASIADLTVPAASTQYLKVPISATVNGGVFNPSADNVSFAFPRPGVAPSTWFSGSWETVSGTYYARVLIGPTGGVVTLGVGLYNVFVKISDNPESPVVDGGTLEITP